MELQPKVKFDRHSTLQGFEEREQGAARDLVLFLHEEQGKLRFIVQGSVNELDNGEVWRGDLAIDKHRLHGEIQRCRNVWRNAVIMHKEGSQFLFQKQWDLSAHGEVVDKAIAQVAVAGRVLFDHLFFPKDVPVDFNPKHLERLNRIGEMFEQRVENPLRMRVTSDVAYVPWNLLYAGPIVDWIDGKGTTVRGFWGYQHEIEHTPGEASTKLRFALEPPVGVSMHLDEGIDKQFGVPCNADVIAMFKAFEEVDVHAHNQRKELATLLSKPALDQRVFYFCCHATGVGEDTVVDKSDAFLKLTDKTPIRAADMAQWLTNTTFSARPIVFLNACQTGQMNFIFHQGFAPVFLRCGAGSVVGTQTEIPPLFASRFAQQFFCAFLSGQGRVGDILFRLRRRYADEYRNPLALLYSVYHGADVYMQKPLNRLGSIQACDDADMSSK